MPNPFWQKVLQDATTTTANNQRLNHLQLRVGNNARNEIRMAVVGVGNDLRGDDAAGLQVVRQLREKLPKTTKQLLVIDAGSAPENFTGVLRPFKPDLVVFIDAAEMGKPAGEIAWIEPDEMDGLSASSHILPLSMLAEFLVSELGCRVGVIGIQVGKSEEENLAFSESLSPPVLHAVQIVSAEILRSYNANFDTGSPRTL